MAKNNKQKQFAVLGLGRFGTSVALTLHELGYQVLGVDSDEEIVQDLSHELTHVVSADASDENTKTPCAALALITTRLLL